MHTRAVVTKEWLRHEGSGLAPLVSNVLDDVLELQDVVSCANERVEAVVDLALAGGTDLVVAALDRKASSLELENDVVAHVGVLVDWRNREVAALVWGLVGKVSALFGAARVPSCFRRVDEVHRTVLLVFVANVIEDEELCLRCEERGVCNTGAGEVSLCLLGNLTWVAAVDLTVARVVDVEQHDQGLLGAEGIEVGGGHIWDELHVGLVDRSEATDRRTIEELTVNEELLVDHRCWKVEVLLNTRKVGEAHVKELNIVVLDVLHNL